MRHIPKDLLRRLLALPENQPLRLVVKTSGNGAWETEVSLSQGPCGQQDLVDLHLVLQEDETSRTACGIHHRERGEPNRSQNSVLWQDILETRPPEDGAVLFVWDGTIMTGWPLDDPQTDPLQWEWECVENGAHRVSHVRYWAVIPPLPAPVSSDSWLTCLCASCEHLRQGDRGVTRMEMPKQRAVSNTPP